MGGHAPFSPSGWRDGQGGGNAVDIYEVKYKESQDDRCCLNCGTIIDGSQTACNGCNISLKEIVPSEEQIESNEIVDETLNSADSSNSKAIRYYAVGCVVLVIVAFLYVMNRKKHKISIARESN